MSWTYNKWRDAVEPEHSYPSEAWWEAESRPPRREQVWSDELLLRKELDGQIIAGTIIRPAENEYEALMECAPGDTPRRFRSEYFELRRELHNAIDELPERERWVFEAHFYRERSLSQIAKEMSASKTTVWRWWDSARHLLREMLADNPEIQRWLR